jgi:hypothetical protein
VQIAGDDLEQLVVVDVPSEPFGDGAGHDRPACSGFAADGDGKRLRRGVA